MQNTCLHAFPSTLNGYEYNPGLPKQLYMNGIYIPVQQYSMFLVGWTTQEIYTSLKKWFRVYNRPNTMNLLTQSLPPCYMYVESYYCIYLMPSQTEQ